MAHKYNHSLESQWDWVRGLVAEWFQDERYLSMERCALRRPRDSWAWTNTKCASWIVGSAHLFPGRQYEPSAWALPSTIVWATDAKSIYRTLG